MVNHLEPLFADERSEFLEAFFIGNTVGLLRGAHELAMSYKFEWTIKSDGVFGENTVGAAEKYTPRNIKMAKDSYLKQKGIDAHALKQDFIGKKNIAHYDLYVDKDSGMLWIYRKGGIGEPIPTYEYIK